MASGTRAGSGTVAALDIKSASSDIVASSRPERRIQPPAETATAKKAASANGIPAKSRIACNGLTALTLDVRHFAAPPGGGPLLLDRGGQ